MKKSTNYNNIPEKDEIDRPPSSYKATKWDLMFIVYAIVVLIIDVGLDINLAYTYFINEEYVYFILTLIFMILPSLIITVVSSYMYAQDKFVVCSKSDVGGVLYIFFLIFQQAAILRYIDSMRYALRSRKAEKDGNLELQKKYYKKMLREDTDIALLRIFKCYLESAPQQILQITILLVDYHEGTMFYLVQQVLSIISSFVAMSLCIVTYNRAIRFEQDDKNNISWTGSAVQGFWHLFVAVSRIVSISILASTQPIYTSVGAGIHWLLMTIWLIALGQTSFTNSSVVTHIFFSSALGLVYIFNYINIHEGSTRRNYAIYYTICFIENIACVVLWAVLTHHILKSSWYFYPAVIVPIFSFVMGMVLLVVYYKYFHPKPLITDGMDTVDTTHFFKKTIVLDVNINRKLRSCSSVFDNGYVLETVS